MEYGGKLRPARLVKVRSNGAKVVFTDQPSGAGQAMNVKLDALRSKDPGDASAPDVAPSSGAPVFRKGDEAWVEYRGKLRPVRVTEVVGGGAKVVFTDQPPSPGQAVRVKQSALREGPARDGKQTYAGIRTPSIVDRLTAERSEKGRARPSREVRAQRFRQSRADTTHSVTGVKYSSGGDPEFDSVFDFQMSQWLIGPGVTDSEQMQAATVSLREDIRSRPELKSLFTEGQIHDIERGRARVRGFTWHHHEDGVTLQLVDRWKHSKTGHYGGRHNTGGRPK